MTLIFVYNADNDFASSATGIVRKLLAPKTYQCHLCQITYPRLAMSPEWKRFVATLPYTVEFLHRSEFRHRYPARKDTALPAVFVADASHIRLAISSDDINKARDISELISIVSRFVSADHRP